MIVEVRTEATLGKWSRCWARKGQDPSSDLVALFLVIKQGGGREGKNSLVRRARGRQAASRRAGLDSQLAAGAHRVQTWTEGGRGWGQGPRVLPGG